MALVLTQIVTTSSGIQEARAIISVVSVPIAAGGSTGSAPHQMGRVPTGLGYPTTNLNEGYAAKPTATLTDVTVTLDAPVSQNAIFTVVCYGL